MIIRISFSWDFYETSKQEKLSVGCCSDEALTPFSQLLREEAEQVYLKSVTQGIPLVRRKVINGWIMLKCLQIFSSLFLASTNLLTAKTRRATR